MSSAENWWLALWTFSADNILVIVYFFPINIWHLETIRMKCQILFSRKKYENVQIVCWKKNSTYNILKYFSYFSQKTKTKTCSFGDNINLSSECGISPESEKG